MLGQSRFATVQSGIDVLSNLIMPREYRLENGSSFVVDLKVLIRRADSVDEAELSIHVERLDLDGQEPIDFDRYQNRDARMRTVARMLPVGKPFNIDVFIPFREAHFEGATVFVPEEMSTIIQERFHREIEQGLSQDEPG